MNPVPKPIKVKKGSKVQIWNKGLTKFTDMRVKKNSEAKVKGRYRKCEVCGKNYWVYPYRTLTTKVCSYRCAGELKKNKIKRICRTCGEVFYTNPSQFKYYKGAGKYCSRNCSYKGIIKETEGKPIKDKYGRSRRNADLIWQRAIREKDNSICRRCGIYQKSIHTHHIAPRSRRPDLKHDISNGMCLCGRCHSWVHNNVKESTKLGYLSTEKYEKRTRI